MATTTNNGWFSGDILAYKGYAGNLYGVKALKEVYIDLIGEYRWVYAMGRITDNKFVADSDSIGLGKYADLKRDYNLIWTPDKELSPVKGDILTGKNADGNIVVLFFESEDRVFRLNPLSSGGSDQSNASLAFYKRKLTDLKVMKDGALDRKFSDI